MFAAAILTLLAIQQAASPVGTWEGVLDAPRGPVVLTVRIEQDTGWKGTLSISGQQPIPLQDITFEEGYLRFTGDNPRFDLRARVDTHAMEGTWTQSGQSFSFRLGREAELPPPSSRVEAWRQDLDIAERKLLRYDRSFDAEEARRFSEAIGGLRQALAKKSDAEIIVGLARAVAIAENAHTRLYILRNRTELRRLPVRLWWFADGLRVVRATVAHRDLVGCAVTRIGKHSPSRVRETVAPLFAGNASWREYMSVYSMTSPEVLFGLGLVDSLESISLQFRCSGRTMTVALAAPPLAKRASPTEAWWDLSPGRKPTTDEDWISPPVVTPLPTYLRHPETFYWHEYLPDSQALYVNYSRSQQMSSGPPLGEYAQTIAHDVRDKPLKKIVIDLRFNTGGDAGLGRAVMEELRTLSQSRKATVAVISGRATFSAGLIHLAQWKGWGATIVGEPAGDELDFWAEGGNIVLPNSRLYVHYANGFHRYSRKEYPQFRPYFAFADLNVNTIAPDVPARMTFDQYVRGEDPALQAALALR
jgi:hypothetical protein